jgi:hypothetical protein
MVLHCSTLVYITPKTHPSGALKLNKVQRYVRVISDTATVAYQSFSEMKFFFHVDVPLVVNTFRLHELSPVKENYSYKICT